MSKTIEERLQKLESEKYYTAGDTYVAGGYYVGTFTSGNSTIQFTVTVSKYLTKVRTATISGNVIIRHADGGYIANVKEINSLGTISVGYKEENTISFGLTLNTPLTSFANNSVVSIALQDCIITFQ